MITVSWANREVTGRESPRPGVSRGGASRQHSHHVCASAGTPTSSGGHCPSPWLLLHLYFMTTLSPEPGQRSQCPSRKASLQTHTAASTLGHHGSKLHSPSPPLPLGFILLEVTLPCDNVVCKASTPTCLTLSTQHPTFRSPVSFPGKLTLAAQLTATLGFPFSPWHPLSVTHLLQEAFQIPLHF